jgi:hypothetical protein
MTQLRQSPISKQLEAYDEGWMSAHAEAMNCRIFEDLLAVGISIFRAIARSNAAWRQRVSQGLEDFNASTDEERRAWFQKWLQPYEAGEVLSRLEGYEAEFGFIEGAMEFRTCYEEAKQILAHWTPPVLSKAVGLHAVKFTAEEGKRLNEILSDGTARLQLQPRKIHLTLPS